MKPLARGLLSAVGTHSEIVQTRSQRTSPALARALEVCIQVQLEVETGVSLRGRVVCLFAWIVDNMNLVRCMVREMAHGGRVTDL